MLVAHVHVILMCHLIHFETPNVANSSCNELHFIFLFCGSGRLILHGATRNAKISSRRDLTPLRHRRPACEVYRDAERFPSSARRTRERESAREWWT